MTITQPDLFSAPVARASDPETSHLAAKDAAPRAGTNRALALRYIRAAGVHGLTDFELAYLANIPQTSIGVRRGELVRQGFVTKSDLRRPSPSGSLAAVWVATDMEFA